MGMRPVLPEIRADDQEQAMKKRITTITELLQRAEARDKRLEQLAIEAERNGDAKKCWMAMEGRAENRRLIAKLQR